MSMLCPCQSGLDFAQCCLPYLNESKTPQTAETLMRARYSAYHQMDIHFIRRTMKPPASLKFSSKKAKIWARSVIWQKLCILGTQEGNINDTVGWVTFQAHYKEAGKHQVIEERSRFEKQDGRWYYVDVEQVK